MNNPLIMARDYQLKKPSDDEATSATPLDEMDYHLAILEALADGVEPLTGEPLPDDSFYHHRKVMAALQAGFAALQKQQKKETQRAKLPVQAGKPWTDEEDQRLLEAFDNGSKVKELAEEHGRTSGAIQSRLTKKARLQA